VNIHNNKVVINIDKNILPMTVKPKIFADKNICENNICGMKIPLFHNQEGHFHAAKIFTANIFIRNFLAMAVCTI
jgi:hypothetical protein